MRGLSAAPHAGDFSPAELRANIPEFQTPGILAHLNLSSSLLHIIFTHIIICLQSGNIKLLKKWRPNYWEETSNPHSISHNVCGKQLGDLSCSMSVCFSSYVNFPLDEIHLLFSSQCVMSI